MEILRTPRQVRNALCDVMQNARRRRAELPAWAHGVAPYSSAWWFDGWREAAWRAWLSPPRDGPCVRPAGTSLLATGWRRVGLIGVTEVPAAGRDTPPPATGGDAPRPAAGRDAALPIAGRPAPPRRSTAALQWRA